MDDQPRLPDGIRVLLFDVDGVLTDTASVHAKAWKETFDDVIRRLAPDQPPFDAQTDYQRHVDGRSRFDGVRGFLRSRAIDVPEGDPDDPPDKLTVQGIGRRKNDRVLELIRSDGVRGYDDAASFVRAARDAGYRTAVVSSSANAREALTSIGLDACFDAWVDGIRLQEDSIKGKPAPDMFLAAARDLGAGAADAAVFEDAEAGVAAGRAGDFGWVLGIDRVGHGHADALREHGADAVVSDLTQVELGRPG